MKIFQTVLSLAILGLFLGFGYHYGVSNSLDRRVGEHEQKLTTVSQESQKHAKDLSAQGELLGATRKDVGDHAARIEQVEKRLGEAELKLGETASGLDALKASSSKDRESLSKMQAELGTLKADHERLQKSLRDAEGIRLRVDLDLDRRLKELEKRAGVPPPPSP